MVLKNVRTLEELQSLDLDFSFCIFQNVDFTSLEIAWSQVEIEQTYFISCLITNEGLGIIAQKGAVLLHEDMQLPFHPLRTRLYSVEELNGFSDQENVSRDKLIYDHFITSRYSPHLVEALWQRLHDYSIDVALRELIGIDIHGRIDKRVVAIMGGHSTLRTDSNYAKIAALSYKLARLGYFIASGGGPGIMEAANLGAYMKNYSEADLHHAIKKLSRFPHYTDDGYLQVANDVLNTYDNGAPSLAIPTWFYGHEPSNLFSSYIAKYFSNSIREDTLLSIALHGVVFAPGSAGTFQEIFMDFCQNYYSTFAYVSPMIFLDKEFYEDETSIYPVVKQIGKDKEIGELTFVSNEVDEIVEFIKSHPPIFDKA